jgi:hypothetical protein
MIFNELGRTLEVVTVLALEPAMINQKMYMEGVLLLHLSAFGTPLP